MNVEYLQFTGEILSLDSRNETDRREIECTVPDAHSRGGADGQNRTSGRQRLAMDVDDDELRPDLTRASDGSSSDEELVDGPDEIESDRLTSHQNLQTESLAVGHIDRILTSPLSSYIISKPDLSNPSTTGLKLQTKYCDFWFTVIDRRIQFDAMCINSAIGEISLNLPGEL
jgi:hypothetical protein